MTRQSSTLFYQQLHLISFTWVAVTVIDSTPSLGVYYFLLLTLSVCIFVRLSVCLCLSVCLSQTSNWIFFFVSRWNRAIFGRQFSMIPLQTLFLDFFIYARSPKFTPQNLHKIAYKWSCMTDRPDMFRPTRGFFEDGRFNGTMQNVVGPTLVAMATKFGLKSPITRFIRHIDRRCLHTNRGFSGMDDSMEPCKMLCSRPLFPWQRHLG